MKLTKHLLTGILILGALPVYCAEYNPIEFKSNATYGSEQWQIDRANWNIINNHKFATYETLVEGEIRAKADTTLRNSIQNETNNRVAMDNYIQNLITDERTNRINADKVIKSNIDNVITGYHTEDQILSDRIQYEEDTRMFMDDYLDKTIKAETEARKTNDGQIREDLSNNWKDHEHLKANNIRLENKTEMNRQEINSVKQDVKANWEDHKNLQQGITNNTKTIKHLGNKVEYNAQQIDYNAQRIQQNSDRINKLDRRVGKLDEKIEGGLATVSALTALHPNPRFKGRTQIAVGAGMYADNVAGAVGIFHWINDRIMLSGGASYGGDSQWAGNIGLSIGIGSNK